MLGSSRVVAAILKRNFNRSRRKIVEVTRRCYACIRRGELDSRISSSRFRFSRSFLSFFLFLSLSLPLPLRRIFGRYFKVHIAAPSEFNLAQITRRRGTATALVANRCTILDKRTEREREKKRERESHESREFLLRR